MLEIVEIAKRIDAKIAELEAIDREILGLSESSVRKMAAYEKKLAVVLVSLGNGRAYSLEGEKVENPPVTLREKIARGLCADERLDAEVAAETYKAKQFLARSCQAQLNGLQSIFRHLSVLPESE